MKFIMILNNKFTTFTNNMNRILSYTTNNYSKLLEISKNIVKNKNEDYRDVCNELICDLIELPQEKKDTIKDIKAFFIGMCKISVYYETSPYQRKYNQLKRIESEIESSCLHLETEDTEEEIDFDCVAYADKAITRNLFWYEKTIFNMHVKDNITFEEMARQTRIPKSSIYKIYVSARNKLKKSYDRKIIRERNKRLRESMER